ncbi:hypothetical protein RJ639_046271 [Escallonia herrerae]|uniref:Chorismate mutase n=1 Tax=Escallonia herrerae TaxID=1293975 RepID=A0AA88W6K8_9ASTE|nr:hypothetical protein RJ639_046271 [Escallonia herrerae]
MADGLTLECVRESLIRQEDTIVFSLIERSNYPMNSPVYVEGFADIPGFTGSLVEYVVRKTQAVHSTVGRYESQEEHPFFPDNLLPSLLPSYNHPKVLHPAGDAININTTIWDMYFNQLLPLFATEGDDSNYAQTAACDLECLQALSRRIHYGKYVAEVKFKDSPDDYGTLIRAQDRDALMKLLTCEAIEEMVKRRVEKKAMAFGQEVTLNGTDKEVKYKVDPFVVSRLYEEWVMPLTKLVEVEYLLRRLD